MPKGTSRLLAILFSGCTAISSCTVYQPVAPQQPAPKVTVTTTPAPGGSSQNPAQGQLEQLLAPIALYPDALLAQILMASTYPLEIVEAARWSKANPKVQGTALEDAMQKQTWDPSVKSLTAFPQVLQMMNEKLSWTQQLGDAFLADQKAVMTAAQKLRLAANQQGNLKSSKEQKVVVDSGATETIITIEPTDPAVVYVPTYDPAVIYGAWPYPAYPPYYYYPPGYMAGAAFWSFTAGVIVGGALWGGCNWGGNNVYVDHHKYNNFNRTNISGDNRWNHNVEHRRGVSYKDQRVAQQYNRGANSRDVQSREQFRGRAEAGRGELGQGGFDRGNQAGTVDRGGLGGREASAGTRDVPRDGGNRDFGGQRDGGASAGPHDFPREFGGGSNRDFSGGRQASGFGGADSGRQASDFGSRGASSRQNMGSGGGRSFSGGGGSFSGGRGGGGRGGGGRR